MKHKLTLDKSNKVEISFSTPSPHIRDLTRLDSLACSMHAPALIVKSEFVDELNLIRFQRNSQYKLLIHIDLEGQAFGVNKIHKIRESINVDGYEIGLTLNKNENELFNEISAINHMFTSCGSRYFIRWVINANKNIEHINNCYKALAKAHKNNINYEMITIYHDSDNAEILHKLVKSARKSLNMQKAKIKIKSKFCENIIKHDSNILYEFEAEELI